MKPIWFIFVLTLSYCNAQMMAATKTCTEELKLEEKDVAKFYKTISNLDTASPQMQCHLKCSMEKLGQMNNGVFDADKASKDWKEYPELVEFKFTDPEVIANCKNEKGANDCETAFKIYKCLRNKKAT